MKIWIILILLLLPALTQAGTVYKSVGTDGKITYSDQPPSAGKVAKTLNLANLPATPLPDSVVRYRNELEKSMKSRLAEARKAPDMNQTALLSAQWCGYCKQAKAYLSEKNIAYTEYDIDTPEGMKAMVESGGGGGVPVLLWHGQKIKGFSRAAYVSVFGASR